ncbi:MAG: glutathione S-transferase family protein [Hyphomicrobiaceae bacterium]
MIDLYTWATPNGRKVSIMLEETGLDYTVHTVNIMKDEQFAPDFLKISPNNKIPAIVDQENNQSIFDSVAILLYLAEKTGKLMPTEQARRWDAMQWLIWQSSSLGPMLGQAHVYLKFNPDLSPPASQRFGREAERLYSVLDRRLADEPFVAGEYSIADIAIFPWTARFAWHQIDLQKFSNVFRWYQEIAARPAVQKGFGVPKVEDIPMP